MTSSHHALSERVSYVVPVYNGARYLAECLDSVLAQTYAPAELIVVDDGSTDATAEIAASFGTAVVHVHQENRGHAAARNRGVAIATGDLLAFVDSDDVLAPEKTEIQLARFRARPELELCDAYYRNFWSPEIPASDRRAEPRLRFTHGEKPRGHGIITWMLRRELFERIGGFDESLRIGEDLEWLARAQAAGARCETVPQVLARRRLHDANLTLTHYDEVLRLVVRHGRGRMAAVRGGG